MKPITIISGTRYADIDALACAVAYKNLLELQGKKSYIYLQKLNQSVSPTVLSWNLPTNATKKILEESSFVVMDVSDPNHIMPDSKGKIIKLFDHHTGFERYWEEELGKNAVIEYIGACATFIYEECLKLNVLNQLDSLSLNLLYTAILSNTLNLKSSITHKRDINAVNRLEKIVTTTKTWRKDYFFEVEADTWNNTKQAVLNDTKVVEFENLKLELEITQIELWNSKDFLNQRLNEIISASKTFNNPNWFLTSPSISEGINYIYSENPKIQELLSKALDVDFQANLAKTKKLYLRKEIIKLVQQI